MRGRRGGMRWGRQHRSHSRLSWCHKGCRLAPTQCATRGSSQSAWQLQSRPASPQPSPRPPSPTQQQSGGVPSSRAGCAVPPHHPDTGGGTWQGGAVTCLEPALRWFSPAPGPPCTSACHRSTSTGHRCCPRPAAPHGGCQRPSPAPTGSPPPDGDKLKSGHIVTQNMMTPLRKHLPPFSPPTMPQQQYSCSSRLSWENVTPGGRRRSLSVQGGI